MWGDWSDDRLEEETRGPTNVFKGGEVTKGDC